MMGLSLAMPTPTPQRIYDWVLEGIQISSPTRPTIEYVREAVVALSGELDELASLEIANKHVNKVTEMLSREQVRAIASGVVKFEIIGTDDTFLKGFAVPMKSDSPKITARRKRAELAEPVRNALLSLSSREFEVLWRLIVKQLGGREFTLTSKSGDEGIDFTAKFNVYRLSESLPHAAREWLVGTEMRSTIMIIGQAKHMPTETLRPSVLRELVGTMFLHNPDIDKGERKSSTGMLVTTGRFSANAEFQARGANIILMDGEWVVSAIINFGLGVSEDSGELIFKEGDLKKAIQEPS